MQKSFRATDCGCWIDGTYGTGHRRRKLAVMLFDCSDVNGRNARIVEALGNDPSDDCSEELEAIEILQENTEDGLVWDLDNGDLCLVEESELE